MTKIVVISDTHGDHWKVKLSKGDILIHAGDCTYDGSYRSFLDFITWFKKQTFKYKIFIAGNHDAVLDKQFNLVKDIISDSGCIYLENSGVEIKGIKFYGSPTTPSFNDWFFMAERGPAIKKYWDNIPNDVDILITHGPPMTILDWVPRSYTEMHLGCRDLYNRVLEVKPQYHIFGHIHYSYGIHECFGIKFINASCMDEEYNVVNKPKEIIWAETN